MKGSLLKLISAMSASALVHVDNRIKSDDLLSMSEINSVPTRLFDGSSFIPEKFLNQRQRRKQWAQAPHMRNRQSKRAR